MYMVATSNTCYDVVTFLTPWGKSASKFFAISSLVVKLLKKCRVRQRVGHTVVEALRYKLEVRGFEFQWRHWDDFYLIYPAKVWSWGPVSH